MVVHPDKGLVIPAGSRDEPCLDMYNSTDAGKTWRHERIELSDAIHPMEPTAIYHEGHLIFLTRNQPLPFRWYKELREPQRPAMMVSATGWFPVDHMAVTNISSYRWPDTTDVDYNPVTERYEAVVTNRSGGGPGSERNEFN
jgi:predicted neuraminidase